MSYIGKLLPLWLPAPVLSLLDILTGAVTLPLIVHEQVLR